MPLDENALETAIHQLLDESMAELDSAGQQHLLEMLRAISCELSGILERIKALPPETLFPPVGSDAPQLGRQMFHDSTMMLTPVIGITNEDMRQILRN